MRWIDCTLRDGGYYNLWDFPQDLVELYLDAMIDIGVDYVEIGLRSMQNTGFKGAYAYTTESHLDSLKIPCGLKIGVMINASELLQDTSLHDCLNYLFPVVANDSQVQLVRIACHVHEFSKALPASTWLKDRGYEVGFNLMQVAERSEEELLSLAEQASSYPVDVLYFADSMGSMSPDQAVSIASCIRKSWAGPIGIHTHDNKGLALTNTLAALGADVEWVDSTVTGMGRGPGNARTEELVLEIADNLSVKPNLIPLMQLVRRYFKPMQQDYGWGKNPYYYLAGKYGIHPTFIQEMLNDARYDDEDILAVISHLKIEGGKKFSNNALEIARSFYNAENGGTWCPVEALEGREVLLIGSGPGVLAHRGAIEGYIKRCKPVVIAMNTMSTIDETLIDLRIASHPIRLLSDCDAYCALPQPLVTPFSALSDDLKSSLEGKTILDYGISVQSETFSVSKKYATLPSSLVMGYALAVSAAGNVNRVLMAGFDGYGSDDPRSLEVNNLISLYQQAGEYPPLVAVTPTRYLITKQSIYSM